MKIAKKGTWLRRHWVFKLDQLVTRLETFDYLLFTTDIRVERNRLSVVEVSIFGVVETTAKRPQKRRNVSKQKSIESTKPTQRNRRSKSRHRTASYFCAIETIATTDWPFNKKRKEQKNNVEMGVPDARIVAILSLRGTIRNWVAKMTSLQKCRLKWSPCFF